MLVLRRSARQTEIAQTVSIVTLSPPSLRIEPIGRARGGHLGGVAACDVLSSIENMNGLGFIGPLTGSAAAASSASNRVSYNPMSGALSYDAYGGGGTAQVQFANLTPGLALSLTDFAII